ncbi:hypothetical protein [Desulfoluna spongiiphila]|uniref:hypothetical protein n=1 Tax=Desulfoluna spongiiphila TaxID=419481 RepID=UPI001251C1F7|nr:hypothetical protein [Desulfoluna spongiiphila]VVS93221.1 hypothetical protein DBB_27890 [Desulfoluna spongiiphila]
MESENRNRIGVASLFDAEEIKEYFNTFFILLSGIEFVIFVAHFIGSIGPESGPFPWKQYFFVSFIAPLVMVFLIGLVVIGFNFYLFGNAPDIEPEEGADGEEEGRGRGNLGRTFQSFVSVIHQLPALAGIFILGLGSVVLYKLDVILATIGHVGERTAYYLFIGLGALVAGTLIFLLFWLFWKFKLQKYQMEQRWNYRNRVMEKTGLIILDNNTVINEEGKVLVTDESLKQIEGDIIEEKLLPEFKDVEERISQ